jgi:hypothetical protein
MEIAYVAKMLSEGCQIKKIKTLKGATPGADLG